MNTNLHVGIAGLGTVGREVAQRLRAGIPSLTLAAVAVRDPTRATDQLDLSGVEIASFERLSEACDVVVECLPPSVFRDVAAPAVAAGCIFMPLSVGQLLPHWDLVEKARGSGSRILVPTGALLGLDAVRAAAEGEIHSVTLVTRKPPAGLMGAPHLQQHAISLTGLDRPVRVFDGSAREAARGFPANVNVAVALSLAGIGPDRTRVEIWADPTTARNTHHIEVDADSARFSMTIEGLPSPSNPRTGRLTALSVIAALRGLVSELKVGS